MATFNKTGSDTAEAIDAGSSGNRGWASSDVARATAVGVLRVIPVGGAGVVDSDAPTRVEVLYPFTTVTILEG